ncbi:MAG TPA: hypothetical protein VLQ20_02390 [Planococcus sp. (in: firmicutes)]|nr:hypothetical protein [Planococcus sp. (in: firmicutes)]
MNADEIWNAMVDTISAMDYPTGDSERDEAFLLFQYHSVMESGGHESFLNSFEEDIERIDPAFFFRQLVQSLAHIGGTQYGEIEKKYGLPLWESYKALENDESGEEAFYTLIEKADKEYEALDSRINGLMEAYFKELYKKWGSN